jgi:hypothetical protein
MSEIIMLPVGPIRRNPAQMRRQYDLGKLAELTLQIESRGFDADRPLLVRSDGNGSYENVRGHRRRMATLMAAHLPEGEWTIDSVRSQWETLVDTFNGDVEAAAEALAEAHGEVEVPVVIFEGDAKSAILALWSDNYGDEDPDPLGVATSLLIGIKEYGILPDEAVRNMGQQPHFVERHLALAQVSPALARRIVNKEMSMSMAVIVMGLDGAKREALTQFLLAAPSSITVDNIKRVAKHLKELSFEMPWEFPHSTRRNVARAFINLWNSKIGEDDTRAYLGACIVFSATQEAEPPWSDSVLILKWFQALGISTNDHWAVVLEGYLTEVSCVSCPIAKLPSKILKTDITRPAGLPCRMGHTVQKCMHGLAPHDPFHMRVPMDWGSLSGVKGEAGKYYVDSYTDLESAWTEQTEIEAKQSATEDRKAKKAATAQRLQKKETAVAKQPEKTPEPEGPSEVEVMRAKVGLYITSHGEMNAKHLLATPCEACQHRLDESPTADPATPHCAWASHKRSVTFSKLTPRNKGEFEPIPVCQQFAPAASWQEIIPEHPEPGRISREWMVAYLLKMVQATPSGFNGYRPFQWLTGRPMRSSENYTEWFAEQLKSQQGNLSDAQIYTLFVLVHDEWSRCASDRNEFYIPMGGALQMVSAKLENWRMKL